MQTTPEEQLSAWLFVKWLTETEHTAYWAQSTGYFPVRRSAAEGLRDYGPEYGRAFSFLDLGLVVEPGYGSWNECRGSINEMLVAAVLGGDPASLLENTLDECNGLWEE
jgi:ABC-type glycerol-3-phosphate transport system substrate-binding protein